MQSHFVGIVCCNTGWKSGDKGGRSHTIWRLVVGKEPKNHSSSFMVMEGRNSMMAVILASMGLTWPLESLTRLSHCGFCNLIRHHLGSFSSPQRFDQKKNHWYICLWGGVTKKKIIMFMPGQQSKQGIHICKFYNSFTTSKKWTATASCILRVTVPSPKCWLVSTKNGSIDLGILIVTRLSLPILTQNPWETKTAYFQFQLVESTLVF